MTTKPGFTRTATAAEKSATYHATLATLASVRSLNDLAEHAWVIAANKGFHDDGATVDMSVQCANLHGEVSELWEAYRVDALHEECGKTIDGASILTCLEEELADIIIRVLDVAHDNGVDIDSAVRRKMAYNATREHKHGKKV